MPKNKSRSDIDKREALEKLLSELEALRRLADELEPEQVFHLVARFRKIGQLAAEAGYPRPPIVICETREGDFSRNIAFHFWPPDLKDAIGGGFRYRHEWKYLEPSPKVIKAFRGALTLWIHEVNERLAALNAHADGPRDRGKDAGDVWNRLTDRQRDCLRVLLQAKAENVDTRLRAADIARQAEGPEANDDGFKAALAKLVALGLVESKTGREGGYWLSPRGDVVVKKCCVDTDGG